MHNVQNTQGGAAKAPPIPTMDVTPPPAATGKQIASQIRQTIRDAKNAARDAKNAAKDAQNAAQGSNPGQIPTTAPPPAFDPSDMIPPQAVDISVAFFFTVAFCIVGFPLARAFARRIDRKTELKTVSSGPDLTPQIRQLQDSVDAMAIELERISEGQRFTAKLLAERAGAAK
jgi:hypothetical protein